MINKTLKQLRIAKGIKQNDIAKILGLANSSYCDKENGRRRFTIEEAILISDILEKDVKYIFSQINSHNENEKK